MRYLVKNCMRTSSPSYPAHRYVASIDIGSFLSLWQKLLYYNISSFGIYANGWINIYQYPVVCVKLYTFYVSHGVSVIIVILCYTEGTMFLIKSISCYVIILWVIADMLVTVTLRTD